MNGFEITCFIIGIICLFLFHPSEIKDVDAKKLVLIFGYYTIQSICFVLMIILPLYFNYWRN